MNFQGPQYLCYLESFAVEYGDGNAIKCYPNLGFEWQLTKELFCSIYKGVSARNLDLL